MRHQSSIKIARFCKKPQFCDNQIFGQPFDNLFKFSQNVINNSEKQVMRIKKRSPWANARKFWEINMEDLYVDIRTAASNLPVLQRTAFIVLINPTIFGYRVVFIGVS